MGLPDLIITERPRLAELTTLQLGGLAIACLTVRSRKGLEDLPCTLGRLGGEVRILGRGSNILARDGELPIVLVNTEFNGDKVLAVLRDEAEGMLVRVQAGTPLPLLLHELTGHGLAGLTGLSGIPGTVGGAVAMNAGSFGVEIGQYLRGVTLFSPSLGLVEKKVEEFSVGYRHFLLPGHEGWFFIVAADFYLPKGNSAVLRAEIREYFTRKRATQPVTAASAGCVFKNPPMAPAGQLMDEAGLKGKSVGRMAFSTVHANFMVNLGGGLATEAMGLMVLAQKAVRERFGVELTPEVCIWP